MSAKNFPPPMQAPVISPSDFAALAGGARRQLVAQDVEALNRLINIAKGDTGQGRRVADFLLAWWNAGECGSFDLTNLWAVDAAIAADMVTVFGLIARVGSYPDKLGYEADFKDIIRAWRPEIQG